MINNCVKVYCCLSFWNYNVWPCYHFTICDNIAILNTNCLNVFDHHITTIFDTSTIEPICTEVLPSDCLIPYPIYCIAGNLPTDSGEVNATACVKGGTGCCEYQIETTIKLCTTHYVYYLQPTKECSSVYCFRKYSHLTLLWTPNQYNCGGSTLVYWSKVDSVHGTNMYWNMR